VIEPGPGQVSQVDGEELDDEDVIICPTHPACKAVVLKPNTGIGCTIIFNNIVRCPKTPREACVEHVALECLGPCPFGAKVTSFSIIALTAAWVFHVMLGTCPQ
jgi:hypothetical protein